MQESASQAGYNVLVNDQLCHVDLVDTHRTDDGPAPEALVEPAAARRCGGWILLDCLTVSLILLLPVAFLYAMPLFWVLLALTASIVLSAYFQVIEWVLAALGPPDRPHVIAIIKAPERLFCPRCGDEKTDNYCSACGVNVEREYRKMVRQLAQYVVEDTEEQRSFLESSMKIHLRQVAQQQQRQIEAALAALERQYVMEIVRQRKLLQERSRLLDGSRQLPAVGPLVGGGLANCKIINADRDT